jgi:hypothetical protein
MGMGKRRNRKRGRGRGKKKKQIPRFTWDDMHDKWEEKGLLFERYGRRVPLTLKPLRPRVGLDRGTRRAFMASRAGRIARLVARKAGIDRGNFQ